MKKAATIALIAGVAMASGLEGVEDHSFLMRDHLKVDGRGGILPRPDAKIIAHDDLTDDNFNFLSKLFGKKKKPQQPQQPQQKPTNPDDRVDFEPIHVDLNSNEFFAEELSDQELSILSSLFHKKKKPQHNPDEFKPRDIPSNEFFGELLSDEELSLLGAIGNLFGGGHKKHHHHKPEDFEPRPIPSKDFNKPSKDISKALGDNDLNFLSGLFGKKKKPQHPQQPQQKPTNPEDRVDFEPIHVDLNSNEFFAEDFGDEELMVGRPINPHFDLLKLKEKEQKKKPVEKAIAADDESVLMYWPKNPHYQKN